MLRKSAVAAASLLCLITVLVAAVEEPVTQRRALALKQMKQGNFREAEAGFRALALDPQNDPKLVGQDLRNGIACLNRLNRSAEIDAFREQVIGVHAGNWRLLQSAAQTYIEGPSHGFVVAGKFQRGNRRGGGRYVSSLERDRVRALQLMQQAATLVAGDDDTAGVAAFYFDFARFLAHGRQYNEAWKLQVLTDLSVLPDYDAASRFGFRGPGSAGAPVDADGNPVFYKVPAEFEQAENDGERWRSMLKQTSTTAPARSNQVRSLFAQFLQSQFGVQTMQSYGLFFGRQAVGDEKKDESSPYALHTLNDEETICKLATGIKRLTLPDEFNHVKIFQEVAGAGKSSYGERALDQLAQISENRRQYPQAAGRWNQAIAQYGPGNNERRPKRVKQIVGNWARFEGTRVHPAGAGASIDFRFRNGRKVHFEAQAIKTEKLLEDVKEYLKTRPKRLDYNRLQIGNIGYQLVQNNQSQYLGEVVARWDLDLKPNREHFDKRITVTTPLQKAGAYLLTAKMDQGNVSRIVVWVSDTVIVKKQLDGKAWYFVADAVSGKPIPRANVEFFGYRQRRVGRQYEISTSNFAELTDEDGQVTPNPKQLTREFSWVAIARKQGRLAFLGFEGVWYGRRYDAEYNQIKVFTITDRPVYRPGQKVSFKFWVRNAKYDKDDVSQFAKQKFPIVITNPKGEKILETTIAADEWGGIEGEYELKSDATLGQYRLSINRRKSGIVSKLTGSQLVAVGGGGAFRVEEYKKPEFEVVVEAPKEPSKLGDAIDATIKANYYFGAPVAHAKVHYKVQRTSYSKQWYPIARWDWLYGSGYWWFGYDYAWYPGWNVWGCKRPIPPWWPVRRDPPELVLDNTVEIGADGTVKVRIDTALAKEMHPDQDHEYEITAEVVDASRRTIVGVGKVLVARRPFKVFSWLSRGHYEAGDVVEANFKAQTLDEKPVQGKGEVTLLKVTYDDEGEPTETAVQKWKLDTDERGESRLQFKASSPGQFRIAYKVTDKKKNTIEGGYVFSVRGQGFDGSQFRFNDIEIVTDKKQYKPGETVKAMINTDRVGSTVVLFLRPTNGVYLPPKIIRLTGKSTLQEVAVVRKDMPNFYIEAFTIADARVFEETRNIVVPPEKRVVNVDVQPSAASYTPGQKATVKLKLTDAEGEPFAGSVAMSMYDKSVEYISGGSNVPEIKAFFWKWRRNHNPQSNSSLNRYFSNLLERGETGMSNIGTFGHITGVPEDKSEGKGAGGAFGGGVSSRAKKMAAPGRAMPAMAAMEIADAAPEGQAGTADNLVTPTIRTKFADTAFWDASITTDEDGLAEVKLTMPENLTGWKIRSWAMGHGTNVGQGEAEVVTAKNLLVRMQAPRFFTEKDEVVLSANVHNYLKVAKQAHVVLELDEKTLGSTGSLTQIVEIPAGGEVRVDWRVKAIGEGEAIVRMKALTDEESDAMQMSFPVYVHGMLKTESFAGVIRPKQTTGEMTVNVPAERRINETRLEVRYSPTLAGAMVDALPYLVSYKYKTTDTTLNRFLPTVITQNVLKRMELDLKDIEKKRTNLNAQELGDDAERAKQWQRYKHNPAFSEAEVDAMAKQGLQALTEMQLTDGGWGWFSGYGERSWPHTTALVVHGLQLAEENELAVVPGVMRRGVAWLKTYQDKQVTRLKNAKTKTKPYKTQADNIDALVFMVLVDADTVDDAMADFLYRDRTKISVYALGMYGLALDTMEDDERRDMVIRNIDQYLVQDEENQTAWLKVPPQWSWWYWYGNEVEANAYYLKLLSRTDPKGQKASRLVKYLLNNRKHATYWASTRDTAICVEAMAEFMKASGEDKPDLTIEVYVDGKKQKEVKVDSKNLFSFDNKLVLVGDAVESGPHKIELRKKGTGPLYYNAYLTNFTLEDFITKAGLEIKVNRKYYKLVKQDKKIDVTGSRGQVVGQKVEKYVREEVPNLAALTSGDLVEIELEIDSKNDYEYLMFEDRKAAGFEPVSLKSGYTGNSMGAYMELRDERVTFFVRRLLRGKHSIAYRVRAEIPGKFSALPTSAQGVYAPELVGNSDELKVSIVDRE